MSLFRKTCPACTAAHPVTAAACNCGYRFQPGGGADPHEDAEEQNRLYREYLAARIAQAEAELAVALAQAQAHPHDTEKAAAALLAQQAVHAQRAQMRQLSLHAARGARTRSRQSAQAARDDGHAPAVAPTTTRATPAARPRAAEQKAAADSERAAAAPSATVKPHEQFTRVQAQRAEAVARARVPAAGKRARPAAAATQVCPNCTAAVAADAQRCSCGYTLARAEEVPALSLDAGALAILTGGTSLPGSRRR